MIAIPAEAATSTALVVRFEADGGVLPDVPDALRGLPEVVVRPHGDAVPADPRDAAALRVAQRAARELGRELQRVASAARRRPTLHLLLAAPPELAADLGLRLRPWPTEVWTVADGAWVSRPMPEVTAPAEGPVDLPAPPDAVEAFALGRALGAAPGRQVHVGGLVLSAAAPPFDRALAEGRLDDARGLVDDGDRWVVATRHARLAEALLRAGRPADALDEADASVARAPTQGLAWVVGLEARVRLGRIPDAAAWSARAVQALPGVAELALARARLLLGHGDVEPALAAARQGLTASPDDPDLLDVRAEAAAEVGPPDAVACVRAALARAPERWADAVERLLHVGAVAEAEAVVAAAPGPAGVVARARFALWRGDLDAAAAGAAAGLAADPADPYALLVRAGVHVLSGRTTEGLADAGAALAALGRARGRLRGRGEALAWCAEARLQLGDVEGARRDASAAMTASRRYSVVAHLARVLAASAPEAGGGLAAYAWRPVAAQLGQLADDPAALSSGEREAVHRQLRSIRARLGGNRSSTPTVVRDGRLVALRTGPHPRAEARRVQRLLRTRPADEVLARFDALEASLPGQPLVWTYRGETLLWLGRHAEAEASLAGALALDRRTVWGWIGLGAAMALQGRLDEALATWAEGVATVAFEGPTLFVYRAEVHRLRGDLDAAAADLDHALADKPHRVSAWALRALVAADRGDARGAEQVAAAIRAQNPGLAVDLPDVGPVPWLEAFLAAARGNRSSSTPSWVGPDGGVRFATWRVPGR